MGEVIIKPYREEDIDLVQKFISDNWRKDHPISTNRNLFRWQYKGFGQVSGYSAFQVAKENDKIVGFRAVIPLELQVPYQEETKNVVCYASAMWMIHPDFRGKGLGYEMHHNTEKLSGSSLAIGANKNTSVPIYKRGGYHELTSLHRYILPLKENHKTLQLFNSDATLPSFICKESNLPLTQISDVNVLENIWKKSSGHLFALNRTSEYWLWRYLQSPVFEYTIFGDEKHGIIVARIEPVVYLSNEDQASMKILRLIEAIPPKSSFWKGEKCESFTQLIKGVCKWGVEQDCSLVDFFCSNDIFNDTLFEIGFYLQQENFLPENKSHASLFQPFEKKEWTFNLYLRLDPNTLQDEFDFKNSYFVKSDTDQDRPNLNL